MQKENIQSIFQDQRTLPLAGRPPHFSSLDPHSDDLVSA